MVLISGDQAQLTCEPGVSQFIVVVPQAYRIGALKVIEKDSRVRLTPIAPLDGFVETTVGSAACRNPISRERKRSERITLPGGGGKDACHIGHFLSMKPHLETRFEVKPSLQQDRRLCPTNSAVPMPPGRHPFEPSGSPRFGGCDGSVLFAHSRRDMIWIGA